MIEITEQLLGYSGDIVIKNHIYRFRKLVSEIFSIIGLNTE